SGGSWSGGQTRTTDVCIPFISLKVAGRSSKRSAKWRESIRMPSSPLSARKSATNSQIYCSKSPINRDSFEEFIRDISNWVAPNVPQPNKLSTSSPAQIPVDHHSE